MDDPLPQMLGTVHIQHRVCGRPTCRCRRGQLHEGYYLFWRQRGRLRKRYVRTGDVQDVRAACEARQARQRQQRAAVRAGRDAWRTMTAQLREVEHGDERNPHAAGGT